MNNISIGHCNEVLLQMSYIFFLLQQKIVNAAEDAVVNHTWNRDLKVDIFKSICT